MLGVRLRAAVREHNNMYDKLAIRVDNWDHEPVRPFPSPLAPPLAHPFAPPLARPFAPRRPPPLPASSPSPPPPLPEHCLMRFLDFAPGGSWA